MFDFSNLDISDLTSDDVLDILIDSIDLTKDVSVQYVDRTDLVEQIYSLNFDYIKQSIVYSEDVSDTDVFELQLPRIREDLLDKYKGGLLPVSGFFNKLDPVVVEWGLGLLEVRFIAFKSFINTSDNRFLKDQVNFNETVRFIYDFDQNIYKQISKQDYEKAQRNLQTKQGFQVHQINNDYVRDYIIREQKLEECLGVLKSLALAQTQEVFKLKEAKSIDLKNKQTLIDYLKTWYQFLNKIDDWLYLKLIYNHIDLNEFDLLKQRSLKLLDKVNRALKLLDKLPESLSNITDLSDHFSNYKYVTDLLVELDYALLERDAKLTGYFIFKDDNNEIGIIENYIEIEKRNMLVSEKVTKEDIERDKERLLDLYNKKR